MDNVDKYAVVSAGSYYLGKKGNKDKRIKNAMKFMNKHGVDAEIVRDQSNSNQLTVKIDGEKITAYHGTDIRGKRKFSDLTTDVAIAFGKEHKTNRFKKLKSTGADRYVGHSLGGAMAAYMAGKNKNATVYNAPLLKSKYVDRKNLTSNIIKGDPVSLFNKKVGNIKKSFHKKLNKHTISNFFF